MRSSASSAPVADLTRERARLTRRWPAAVRDVLVVAAQVDRFNRSAAVLGLLPIVDPPIAAIGLLWRGLLDAE